MRRLLRFFLFGPGAVLVVVGIVIGVAYLIKEGQDRQRAEAEKRQVQRPLGQIKPSEAIENQQRQKSLFCPISDSARLPDLDRMSMQFNSRRRR